MLTCVAAVKMTLMWVLVHLVISGLGAGELLEYCQSATFNPRCEQNEVIMVKSARYGRMPVGICNSRAFGHLDCENDVLREMDGYCSGKQTCQVKVEDASFAKTQCDRDLRTHLLVEYECVAVAWPSRSCEVLALTGGEEGYIASHVTKQTHCGSPASPWILQARPGELLNFTLFDFAWNSSLPSRGRSMDSCVVYLTLQGESERRSASTICRQGSRINPVYYSSRNRVVIRIMNADYPFLLHYAVTGCPDPVENDVMSAQRAGNKAYLSCKNSDVSWRQTCIGHNWTVSDGTPVNCSTKADSPEHGGPDNRATVPFALSLTLVVAIALVVGCVLFVVGMVCLKRRNYMKQRPPQYGDHPGSQEYYDTNPDKDVYPKATDTGITPDRSQSTPGKENEYATMRLLRAGCFDRPCRSGSGNGSSQEVVPVHSCHTISSTYDPRRTGFSISSEHTYESPELEKRMTPSSNASTGPQYFDLTRKNPNFVTGGHVSPQYFDFDVTTSFLPEVPGQEVTVVPVHQCPQHSSFKPGSNTSKVTADRSNKYSI